jgi:hypothetical protein
MSEVTDFVNLYMREKALWENGQYQKEPAHPVAALFPRDGEQQVEHVQPVPEAEAGQIMQDLEADLRQFAAGATRTITDADIDPSSLEGLREMWLEPETEMFLEANNEVSTEEPADEVGAEERADHPVVMADKEKAPFEDKPPLVELVTDSFSREDIASGRSFLTFLGLQDYAVRFGEWFGRGTSFREIPGIFDENNELIFSTEDTEKALYRGNELEWKGTALQPMKDPAQSEWLMEALPHNPERQRQLVNPPLQQVQASGGRKSGASRTLPFHPLPSFIQPPRCIAPGALKAVPASASLGHISRHVIGSDQTSRAQPRGESNPAHNPSISRRVETTSTVGARETANKDKQDARPTINPASGEALANAAHSDAQMTEDRGKFSENGIAVEGFPKCCSCFMARARCSCDRPCTSCINKNRKCRDVTKADLDKFPERAERVIKDKAKKDAKVAQGEGEGMTQATGIPASEVFDAKTSRFKRKHSAISGEASAGDDSDLDCFPPDGEDPKDSDYDTTPRNKRPRKGNTPALQKQAACKGTHATPTPTKRAPRGAYQKKAEKSMPKSTEPASGASSAPTRQPGGSTLAGSAVAVTSVPKSGLSQNSGEGNLFLGAETGISVRESAEAVRHPGEKFGKIKVRPVPVGLGGETQSGFDPSSVSQDPSGAGEARYLDMKFALAGSRPHPQTHMVAPRPPMTPMSRPIAEIPGAALCAPSPYGAYPMPVAFGDLMPPRPRMMSAENDQPGGSELSSTSSMSNARMATHEKAASEKILRPQQIAQPGLSGSFAAAEISPMSHSSGSGTTASRDFLSMPYNPAQESPAYSHGSLSGRLLHSRSDGGSMSGLSPGFSPNLISLGSPTTVQRPLPVLTNNNGAHSPAISVPSPMMTANTGCAVVPGPMPPYTMPLHHQYRPHPVSRPPQGFGSPVPHNSVQSSAQSVFFCGHQSEELQSGSRGASASPSHTDSPVSTERLAGASLDFGQKPAIKRTRTSESPLAPPRETRSWQELARTQWAVESQENQRESSKSSVKPVFGGDGLFEVSFTRFSRIREHIDPELQQTAAAEARKINHSPAGTSEKR